MGPTSLDRPPHRLGDEDEYKCFTRHLSVSLPPFPLPLPCSRVCLAKSLGFFFFLSIPSPRDHLIPSVAFFKDHSSHSLTNYIRLIAHLTLPCLAWASQPYLPLGCEFLASLP